MFSKCMSHNQGISILGLYQNEVYTLSFITHTSYSSHMYSNIPELHVAPTYPFSSSF